MGNEGFVSTAEWPKYDEGKIDVKAEEAEEIVRAVLEDTENVIKATGIKPRRICYYTSADWKWKAYLAALNAAETGGLSVGMLMKELLSGIEAKERAEELAKYAKKMIVEVARMPPDMRRTRLQANIINEFEVLKSAVNFYEKEFNAEVEVYNESNPGKYDPKNRAQLAQPYRPAIYVE
jgi:leucyl-tRNA synthetase